MGIVAFQLFLFAPYYSVNDDTFKVFFTQGVGSDLLPSEFIGYSNPLWGLLFKTLFTLYPHVPWYGIALLSIQALSLGALLYAFGLTPHPHSKALFFIVVFLGVFSTFFVSIQYTVTAILASQCAFFLMLSLWQNGRSSGNRAAWWLAGFLVVASSLIRLDGLLIALFCALPLVVYSWASADPSQRRALWKRKLYLLLPALLVAAGAIYNHYWYATTPGWKEFNRFDHERLELQDYRIDPYNEKTKPYFDAAGWTQNDYQMFKDWYFMNRDLYDTDKMRRLAACFPRFGSQGKPASYHSLTDILTASEPQTLLMYFLAFLLLVPFKPWRFLLFQLGWVLAVLALLVYCLRAPDRVILPLLTIPMIAAIYFIGTASPDQPRKTERNPRTLVRIGLVFLGLFFILGLHSYYRSYLANRQAQARERQLDGCLAALNPRPDDLYVTWDSSFPYEDFNIFDNFEIFRKFRVFTLAVYQRSPNAQKMLDHFGIRHLLRDMVDNPHVFLICWPREGILYHQYMVEKYHMEIYPEKTFQCPFFRVFRIHSRPLAGRRKA